MAASRNEAKYAALQTHHIFQPIAVETLGPVNESARAFLDDLGRRISVLSGDDREHLFLFQRISVAIQRNNTIIIITTHLYSVIIIIIIIIKPLFVHR